MRVKLRVTWSFQQDFSGYIDRCQPEVLPDYVLYMEQAGMIGQLRDDTGGIRGIGKVEKVYLYNTSLAYLLGHHFTHQRLRDRWQDI